ncbi:MAG: exodeoxyribonuclease VII large subunit [Deltaproteobacteria bacterium]|nr:exodeoxyribonuclease VII large subunit [Deltaproteobacteria bacterium]
MKDIPFTVELEDEEERPQEPPRRDSGGPGVPGDPGGPDVLTVGQLTRRIRGLLEEGLAHVAVEGELSNVKQAASGHVYFNLKDDSAQVRCVMFRAAAAGLRFEMEDGLHVMLRGRVSVYEQRGEYQIVVLAMEPRGAGALQLAFEQLKARLEAEGLFAPERKRPLPFLPRGIGIVTSPTGAAIRDMLHVLERRFPGMPVLLAPASVQGTPAPGEIAAALRTLGEIAPRQHLDVIICGRGGGSVEDLWAFNSEEVARAIAASPVPVISAVGHETDFTIADFVADLRAPTPSAAAELAVPVRGDLLTLVQDFRLRLSQRLDDHLSLRRERLAATRARLESPQDRLEQLALRLDDLGERLRSSGRGMITRWRERSGSASARLKLLRPDRFNRLHAETLKELQRRLQPALTRHVASLRERLGAQAELLDSLSPLKVLGRGYAVARMSDGTLLRSAGQTAPGDLLNLRLEDGQLETEVLKVLPAEPAALEAGREKQPPEGKSGGKTKGKPGGKKRK